MQGAFGVGIGSEAVGEGIDGVLVGMETKVLLFRGEVDEIALEAEGGHTPGYFFGNIRMAALDQRPQDGHPFPDFPVKILNVFVDGGGVCPFGQGRIDFGSWL